MLDVLDGHLKAYKMACEFGLCDVRLPSVSFCEKAIRMDFDENYIRHFTPSDRKVRDLICEIDRTLIACIPNFSVDRLASLPAFAGEHLAAFQPWKQMSTVEIMSRKDNIRAQLLDGITQKARDLIGTALQEPAPEPVEKIDVRQKSFAI